MIIKRTDFLTFFTLERVWWLLTELILTVFTLGGCGGLESIEF